MCTTLITSSPQTKQNVCSTEHSTHGSVKEVCWVQTQQDSVGVHCLLCTCTHSLSIIEVSQCTQSLIWCTCMSDGEVEEREKTAFIGNHTPGFSCQCSTNYDQQVTNSPHNPPSVLQPMALHFMSFTIAFVYS